MTEGNKSSFEGGGRTPYAIWLVDAQDKRVPGAAVGLPGFAQVFQLAGLTREGLTNWHNKYGYESLGQGDGGILILPEFPILGKLIDVLINSVLLTPSECSELVIECSQLDERAADPIARKTLDMIRSMASRASLQKLFMVIAAH